MPRYRRACAVRSWLGRTAPPVLLALMPLGGPAAMNEERVGHGEDGVPQDRMIPIIWGQKEGYIYLQLRDFKSGVRKNEQMAAVTETLERDDLLALAALFSGRAWPAL